MIRRDSNILKIKGTLYGNREGLTHKELEKKTGIKPSTLSKWLKRMEENREVMRQVYPQDKAVYYVLIDIQFKRYKSLAEWAIIKSYSLGMNFDKKYDDIDLFTGISFGFGYVLTAINQALKDLSKEDITILHSLMFNEIHNHSILLLGEDEKFIDEDVKKEIDGILNSDKEELDKNITSMREELNKMIKEEKKKYLF
ncbi:MAG: hypothetical protein R6U44_01545 [Archaeoglobaceae archaeon]